MENERELEQEQQPPIHAEPGYVERPRWQVWAARLGLVVLAVFLILYYLTIARGGL